MKKCFLLMAGIILLVFAACQSDELANGGRNGEVAASFSVQLPGNGNNAVTRAATAGDGTSVNRCIMEIYLNDELYSRQIGAIQPDGLTAALMSAWLLHRLISSCSGQTTSSQWKMKP